MVVSQLELTKQKNRECSNTEEESYESDGGDDADNELAIDQQRDIEERSSSNFWHTLASVVGNVMEWYDFAVFGFLSDILGDVFFPPDQKGHMAITESFAVFGGAFLMRPVGGCVLGYIGDLYGRKKVLVISIFLMGFPTFAMGCLPTYAQSGDMAIVLLIIVRLLQGFSVGGQLMSSAVYTLENNKREHWGYYGSLVLGAANVGTLLGGLAGWLLRSTLTYQQLHDFGWRIPFLAGVIVSFSGFYLRKYGEEGHHVPNSTAVTPANPIRLAFAKYNRRSLLACTMVPMLWSAGFYLGFVWCSLFMQDLIEKPVPGAFGVNATALFLSVCLFFPYAGSLSDRYGRREVMSIGALSMGIVGPVLLVLIGMGNTALALIAQILIGISLSFFGAPLIAWLVESFEPEARLTSVAIGYNLAQAIAGGTAPALATYLVDTVGPSSPGILLTCLATVALVGLCIIAPAPGLEGTHGCKNGESMQGEILSKGIQSTIRRRGGRDGKFSAVPSVDADNYEDGEYDKEDEII